MLYYARLDIYKLLGYTKYTIIHGSHLSLSGHGTAAASEQHSTPANTGTRDHPKVSSPRKRTEFNPLHEYGYTRSQAISARHGLHPLESAYLHEYGYSRSPMGDIPSTSVTSSPTCWQRYGRSKMIGSRHEREYTRYEVYIQYITSEVGQVRPQQANRI